MDEYPNFNRRVPSDLEAAELISTLSTLASPAAESSQGQTETFILLSRWARQISQRQHSPGVINTTPSQLQTLTEAAHVAIKNLRANGPVPVINLCSAAAILLLGSAAGALVAVVAPQDLIEEVAETVGTALLSSECVPLQPQQAALIIEYVIAGSTALVSTLSYNSDASCWIFTALLNYLGTIKIDHNRPRIENNRIAKSLVTFYPAMRTATAAIVQQQQQQYSCLNSLYGVLRAVILPSKVVYASEVERNDIDLNKESKNVMIVAAATLATGGMLDSLVRHQQQQRPFSALIPVIEALADLLQHSATLVTPINTNKNSSLKFQQIASAVAVAQVFQACRLPRPTPATLQCCVGALVDTVLSIEPLLEVLEFSSIMSAGQLSAALAQHAQQGSWIQYAAPLQLTAGMQFSQVRWKPGELKDALKTIQRACRRTHEKYRQYILQFWTQQRAHVDHRPVQSLLEKYFLSCMELLTAAKTNLNLSSSGRNGTSTLPASIVLSILADLQFCRVNNNPHYVALLKDALLSLPVDISLSSSSSSSSSSSNAAAIDVVGCLPLYKDLEIPVPAHGNAPAWRVDALSASKVQLLFTALTPCCRVLPESLALDILAPLAFLYLLHPHAGTSNAAHTVMWSLMGARAQHAEQLTPYYVTRCLEKLPLSSSSSFSLAAPQEQRLLLPELQHHLQNFSQGLSTALATAHVGSPLGLLCVERILAKCSEMAAAGECWDLLNLALFKVATQQLVTVDFTLVHAVSQQIQEFILGCPARLKGTLSEAVLAMVVGTEDCVRKPNLATWYQDLSSTVASSSSM